MVRRTLVLLLSLLLLGAACSDDDPDTSPATSSSSSATVTSEAPRTTAGRAPTSESTSPPGEGTPMTGAAGTGDIDYTLATERSEFCYRISVRGLGEVTGAHVHRANGEVVLGLQPPPTDGTVDTCAATDALLIQEMKSSPAEFYIDVHGAKGLLKASL